MVLAPWRSSEHPIASVPAKPARITEQALGHEANRPGMCG